MEQEKDVIWTGRPWIGPSVAIRTTAAIIAGIVALIALSTVGLVAAPFLAVPIFIWVIGILAIAWFASLFGLLVLRASFKYELRQSSIEVDRGIVNKKTLLVSPSAFSELEVDQGVVGRMLNYGNLEVRSQGGQELNLMLIRDPRRVSSSIRAVMTVPTVRIAKDEAVVAQAAR